MDIDRLARWFLRFAEIECPDLPFYRRLCHVLAEDPVLLGDLLNAEAGQWRPNLLLAGLHDLVLEHPDLDLARWYPTVGGRADAPGDLRAALDQAVQRHGPRLRAVLATRSTQTNEVNRSALWPLGLAEVTRDLPGQPVAIVELGASAGLNLRFDRYHVRYQLADGSSTTLGPSDSPVELACSLRGPVAADRRLVAAAARIPPVVARIGLDAAPVHLADPVQHRWLKACIWPEQPDRHRRFDAAAALHRTAPSAAPSTAPVRVEAGDAIDELHRAVELVDAAAARRGAEGLAHLVVVNTWVVTYLAKDRRAQLDAAIAHLGQHRAVSRISAEGDGVEAWVPAGPQPTDHTVLATATFRAEGRTDRRVAIVHPHGAWVDWMHHRAPDSQERPGA